MTSATAANRAINNTYYNLLDTTDSSLKGSISATSGDIYYRNPTNSKSHFFSSRDASNIEVFPLTVNSNGVTIQSPQPTGSSTAIFKITDTNSFNKSVLFIPEATAGSFNPIVAEGTSLMYSSTLTAAETTTLTIAPHSITSCGLALNISSVLLGCGGTTSTPTNNVTINGTAGTITLTSVNPPTSSANIPFPDATTKLATTAWVSANFTSGGSSAPTISITDTNTNSTYYPTFVDASGSNVILRADISSTPLTYNPSTGSLGIGKVASSPYILDVSGNVNATSYNTSSDYRIKENIVSLDESFKVDQLRPVTYKNVHSGKQDIGLIAHELQEEYPYLVTGVKDGENLQSVNYIGLIGILIKEIQELKGEVKILKSAFLK
jgi:hypothetical protein